MPTLARLGSAKIQIFADDHNPPHFHVVTAEFEALVSISDLTVLRGRISRRVLEAALEWAKDNRGLLTDEWERLNG